MNVAAILSEKGHDVVTAAADMRIGDVARTLDDKRIGAVVVTAADGSIQGVLSERDITRVIARSGAEGLMQPISESMTRDVITTTPGESLDALMTIMTDRRIRHVPVIRDGALTGIVSIGDVVKRKIAQAEADAEAMKAYIAAG